MSVAAIKGPELTLEVLDENMGKWCILYRIAGQRAQRAFLDYVILNRHEFDYDGSGRFWRLMELLWCAFSKGIVTGRDPLVSI